VKKISKQESRQFNKLFDFLKPQADYSSIDKKTPTENIENPIMKIQNENLETLNQNNQYFPVNLNSQYTPDNIHQQTTAIQTPNQQEPNQQEPDKTRNQVIENDDQPIEVKEESLIRKVKLQQDFKNENTFHDMIKHNEPQHTMNHKETPTIKKSIIQDTISNQSFSILSLEQLVEELISDESTISSVCASDEIIEALVDFTLYE